MAKILFVVTSHSLLGATEKRTGVWLEELATPYYALRDAGHHVAIASIAGGAAPLDPASLQASGSRFLNDAAAMAALRNTQPVSSFRAAELDGLFLPGGHGTMWDFPGSAALAQLVGRTFEAGKVVAAVCHGPAGLVSARRADGRPIVAGRRVSSFTNEEEGAVGLTAVVPFLLEDRLRALGAVFTKGPNFRAHAVRDGNLITGQNPQSSERVAKLVLEALADVEETQ